MAWTSPSFMMKRLRSCHRPTCQTLSNACLESMKLCNRLRWCCRCFSMMTRLLKSCSSVLRTERNKFHQNTSKIWIRCSDHTSHFMFGENSLFVRCFSQLGTWKLRRQLECQAAGEAYNTTLCPIQGIKQRAFWQLWILSRDDFTFCSFLLCSCVYFCLYGPFIS